MTNTTELRIALENWGNDFLYFGRRIAQFYFDTADEDSIQVRLENGTKHLRIKFAEIQIVN